MNQFSPLNLLDRIVAFYQLSPHGLELRQSETIFDPSFAFFVTFSLLLFDSGVFLPNEVT